jgi:hypothetical protein
MGVGVPHRSIDDFPFRIRAGDVALSRDILAPGLRAFR